MNWVAVSLPSRCCRALYPIEETVSCLAGAGTRKANAPSTLVVVVAPLACTTAPGSARPCSSVIRPRTIRVDSITESDWPLLAFAIRDIVATGIGVSTGIADIGWLAIADEATVLVSSIASLSVGVVITLARLAAVRGAFLRIDLLVDAVLFSRMATIRLSGSGAGVVAGISTSILC